MMIEKAGVQVSLETRDNEDDIVYVIKMKK